VEQTLPVFSRYQRSLDDHLYEMIMINKKFENATERLERTWKKIMVALNKWLKNWIYTLHSIDIIALLCYGLVINYI